MISFTWRSITLLGVLFVLFNLANVVITLLLVYEVRDHIQDKVDQDKLRFVEVSNWIYTGVVALALLGAIVVFPVLKRINGAKLSDLLRTGLVPRTSTNKNAGR